jgi:hypothetical protein
VLRKTPLALEVLEQQRTAKASGLCSVCQQLKVARSEGPVLNQLVRRPLPLHVTHLSRHRSRVSPKCPQA